MKEFMAEDFLLTNDTAARLYNDNAKDRPIIDYHCHINPADIAKNKRYETITEAWLGGDHYKWRAMRGCGVAEEYITGNADPKEKFIKWAGCLPKLIGNPLYHWTHLELKRYFGVGVALNEKNADDIYEKCNEVLAREDMSVRGIIEKSRVEIICTTDDPADTLTSHESIARLKGFGTKVLPAFRPEKAMNITASDYPAYIEKLSAARGICIRKYEELVAALRAAAEYFDAHGCCVSDHSLDACVYVPATEGQMQKIFNKALLGHEITPIEKRAFESGLLCVLADEYAQRGWVMQLHYGVLRNNSDIMLQRLGRDAGYDSMGDAGNARALASLLNALEKSGSLPKCIIYPINPSDYASCSTVLGSFQSNGGFPQRMQLGSAWWFTDTKQGMETQLACLAQTGVLAGFVGMLTDSRSFLSYTRHEYFRRILCSLLGTWAEMGEYPMDMDALGQIAQDISYNNAHRYFAWR